MDDTVAKKEIAEASEKYQKSIESGERIIVGVNKFEKLNETIDIPIREIGSDSESKQRKSLAELKFNRNFTLVEKSLENLRQSCLNHKNIMEPIINCARNYATLCEIVNAMKSVLVSGRTLQ